MFKSIRVQSIETLPMIQDASRACTQTPVIPSGLSQAHKSQTEKGNARLFIDDSHHCHIQSSFLFDPKRTIKLTFYWTSFILDSIHQFILSKGIVVGTPLFEPKLAMLHTGSTWFRLSSNQMIQLLHKCLGQDPQNFFIFYNF